MSTTSPDYHTLHTHAAHDADWLRQLQARTHAGTNRETSSMIQCKCQVHLPAAKAPMKSEVVISIGMVMIGRCRAAGDGADDSCKA